MRHLLAAVAALCLFASPALAAVLPAITPATFATMAATLKAHPGDTLPLEGEFPADRTLKGDFKGSVLDLTKAILTGSWYPSGATANLSLKGGVIKATLRFDNGKNITVTDADFRAAGFKINGGANITVRRNLFGASGTGVSFSNVDGGVIEDNVFTNMASDGIQAMNPDNLRVSRNLVHGMLHIGAAHPDVIQMWNEDGHIGRNIVIEGNRGDGNGQGIFIQGSTTPGVVNWENMAINDNDLMVGFANGILANGVRGLSLNRNRLARTPVYSDATRYRLINSTVTGTGNTLNGQPYAPTGNPDVVLTSGVVAAPMDQTGVIGELLARAQAAEALASAAQAALSASNKNLTAANSNIAGLQDQVAEAAKIRAALLARLAAIGALATAP